MSDFDPTQHTVADVQAYLAEHPDEVDDVVAAEAARSDGTEPRKTVLALAPPPVPEGTPPLPPAGTDQPPTAGSEPTGPTAGAADATVLTGSGNQQDGAEAELAAYYERLERLSPDQRAALEAAMDDGTDWNTMREDAVVRASFGAKLTQAEAQITPQTGTFVAPQDERAEDGSQLPRGVQLDGGMVYSEDGGQVSAYDVRGASVSAGDPSPARGE